MWPHVIVEHNWTTSFHQSRPLFLQESMQVCKLIVVNLCSNALICFQKPLADNTNFITIKPLTRLFTIIIKDPQVTIRSRKGSSVLRIQSIEHTLNLLSLWCSLSWWRTQLLRFLPFQYSANGLKLLHYWRQTSAIVRCQEFMPALYLLCFQGSHIFWTIFLLFNHILILIPMLCWY